MMTCPDHGDARVFAWWRAEHGYHVVCKAGGVDENDVGWECGRVLGEITREEYEAARGAPWRLHRDPEALREARRGFVARLTSVMDEAHRMGFHVTARKIHEAVQEVGYEFADKEE